MDNLLNAIKLYQDEADKEQEDNQDELHKDV